MGKLESKIPRNRKSYKDKIKSKQYHKVGSLCASRGLVYRNLTGIYIVVGLFYQQFATLYFLSYMRVKEVSAFLVQFIKHKKEPISLVISDLKALLRGESGIRTRGTVTRTSV